MNSSSLPDSARSALRRVPRVLALVLAGALAAAACADGTQPDEQGSPTPSTPAGPTASPSPTPTPTPTPSPPPPTDESPAAGGEIAPIGDFCLLEPSSGQIEHIEFAAPRGWQVSEETCEFFDPTLEELEEGTEPDAAIGVRVTDVPFAQAAEPEEGTRDEVRYVGARSGYQAVRIRAVGTGEGIRPEGQPVLTYLVDLDPGTDEGGATLVASARPSSGADFDLAAEALDRMFDTFRVVPPDGGQADLERGEPAVITRVEGGGTPFTVTYDGSCLRLRPGGPTDDPADEACDLGAPDDTITGAVLESGSTRVVAGLAPPRAAFVVSDAASAPYGAVTTPLEGAAAFAYTPVEVPVEVHGVTAGGERFVTGTIR